MAYTNIDDPSAQFQIATYTGNGTDNTAITYDGNSDMQPDFLWFKLRSTTGNHVLFDSNRGVTKYLRSNTTAAETTNSTLLKSFNTDGFTVGTAANTNYNTYTLVSWGFKANGGTTSSNTDGSITSTVQANTTAGFSIVTFDSASSGNCSVGHGLGVQPAMIITKNREGTGQWYTWHQHLTGGTSNTSYLLSLNRTDAEASYANAWGAGVTSSVFGMQSGNTATASNDYVAYCFAEKQGYSKFGKYVGNGGTSSTGNAFVYTGFKPAWVMIKLSSSSGGYWAIHDDKRNGYNDGNQRLWADRTNTESGAALDFLSNGFRITSTAGGYGASGSTYIYMAFAENPFVTSTGVPATAR